MIIIEPEILKGGLVKNPHPIGCKHLVEEEVSRIQKEKTSIKKKALIIGASSGYGLSSRIILSFGTDCQTVCLSQETPPNNRRLGSSGWWNDFWVKKLAKKYKSSTKSFIDDCFLDTSKAKVIDYIKRFVGKIDLLIYSVAAPQRRDPKTGILYKSVLKSTIGEKVDLDIDLKKQCLIYKKVGKATPTEIYNTEKVMGGEDWSLWIDILRKENLLSNNFQTTSFSYEGSNLTSFIYKNGTIGIAKKHLEKTALKLNSDLKSIGGKAFITFAKATITKASIFIPYFSLYASSLSKVMKGMNIYEGTYEQINRFLKTVIFSTKIETSFNKKNEIRLDNLEMRDNIQDPVSKILQKINPSNFRELIDFDCFFKDYLKVHGFCVEGVDYKNKIDLDGILKV